MEHLIKQTEDETIKRFELNGKNIWVIRKDNKHGIGETKKQAEKQLDKQWANKGTPDFISQIGSYKKSNNKPEINSVPGALKLIYSLLPLAWHSNHYFRTIVDQNSLTTYLEIAWVLVPESEPLRYWSDDKKGYHQQITNCIYEFYLDREKNIIMKKQHPKLAEWQKVWYSKLSPKRIL